MAEQYVTIRHIQKHETEAAWLTVPGFVPKRGEIIVYDVDENYSYERFKIGDGTTELKYLPFAVGVATDHDLLEVLSMKDIVTPVADATGATYIDEKQNILIL